MAFLASLLASKTLPNDVRYVVLGIGLVAAATEASTAAPFFAWLPLPWMRFEDAIAGVAESGCNCVPTPTN